MHRASAFGWIPLLRTHFYCFSSFSLYVANLYKFDLHICSLNSRSKTFAFEILFQIIWRLGSSISGSAQAANHTFDVKFLLLTNATVEAQGRYRMT